MFALLESPFVQGLGWSLIDSLWQVGAVWGAYSIITANGKRFSAAQRHNIAIGGVAASGLWFLITLFINYGNAVANEHLYSLSYFFGEIFVRQIEEVELLKSSIPFLSVIYLVAIFIYCTRLYYHYLSNRYSYKRFITPASPELQHVLLVLKEKMEISRKVLLWISEKAVSPFTSGFLKPAIFLPVAALNNLSLSQLEAVLAHELQHVKRNDYIINLLVLAFEVLLFFNPFARMLSRIVKTERENSCDDKVLALGFNAWEYSQGLYLLGSAGVQGNDLVMAATGSGKKLLLDRIKRLLKLDQPSPSFGKPMVAFFLCLVVAFINTRSNKNGAVLPVPEKRDVLIYSAQKIVETKTVRPLVLNEKKVTVKKVMKKAATTPQKPKEPVQTVEEPAEIELAEEFASEQDVIMYNEPTFILEERQLEFTHIVPVAPQTPTIINSDCPMPFVPGSTFYCPVDSLPIPAKKIIRI